MTRSGSLAVKVEIPLVVLAFSILAYVIAPVSYGDKRVYVMEGRELDATLGCLLTACGVDKLMTQPLSFYDTAILYPDRNQLRSTEPFLGYALLALPLRLFLHLGDVDAFEVLRWVMIFTSLVYAYLLHKAAGVGVAISVGGAVACLSQPALLNEIERLQVLSIPLILPVLYHALMVWKSSRPRVIDSAGLFFFAALYPLCGAINATICVLAALFVLPLCVKMLADLRRRQRLIAFAVPVVLAAVADAVALAPWLLDRSDLKPYASDAFLQIKHWNPTNLPLRVQHVPPFLAARVGWAVMAALALLSIFAAGRRLGVTSTRETMNGETSSPPEKPLLVLLVAASAMLVVASLGFNRHDVQWLGVLFDIACGVTLLLYWRGQLQMPMIAAGHLDVGRYMVIVSAGLAVFLSFMSFGPVYASNTHPLATSLMRALLSIVPPLKSIREYDRIWTFGMLFLSLYATIRLGMVLRLGGALTQISAAVIVIAAMMFSLSSRRLIASADIAAPADFVELASKSRGTGGVYVHPVMKWNARSGVLMIAIARAVGRPFVNGCLGICPPWFVYASSVLHRFPDPEALWLLRTWNVGTVVGVTGDVTGGRSDDVSKVFDSGRGEVVWEVRPARNDAGHPSMGRGQALPGHARIEADWSQPEEMGAGTVAVKVPEGFAVQAVEVRFAPSIVQRIPDEIGVFASEGGRRVRVNRDRAGEWIESLAADALLRRESPVAVIGLNRPVRGDLHLEVRNSAKPPLEGIGLLGEWREQTGRDTADARINTHRQIGISQQVTPPHGTTFNAETAELAEQHRFSLRVRRVLR